MSLNNQQPVDTPSTTEIAQSIKDALTIIKNAIQDNKIADDEKKPVESAISLLSDVADPSVITDNVAGLNDFLPLVDAVKRIADRYRVSADRAVDILADIKFVITNPLFIPDSIKQIMNTFK